MMRDVPPRPIFKKDGSLDVKALRGQFGLGVTEANQQVRFGRHTGTVAEMLADNRCPVGGMIREAYRNKGIDSVAEQFNILSAMDSNFKVVITQETIERNRRLESQRPQGAPKTAETATFSQAADSPEEPRVLAKQLLSVQSQPEPPKAEATIITTSAPVAMDSSKSTHVPESANQTSPPEQVLGQSTELPPVSQQKLSMSARRVPGMPDTTDTAAADTPASFSVSKATVGEKSQSVIDMQPIITKQDVIASVVRNHVAKEMQKAQRADASPATEAEAIRKRIAAKHVIRAIDVLLDGDIQNGRNENGFTDDEHVSVAVVKNETMITLGVKSTQEGEESSVDRIKPVSTASELVALLDVLNKMPQEEKFLESGEIFNRTKYIREGGLTTAEANTEHPEHSQMQVFVSENMLAFMENVTGILEKMEKKGEGEKNAVTQVKTMNHPMRIFSQEREIVVELTVLKQLIRLVKIRKQMCEDVFVSDDWIIPEELGVHGMDYYNTDDSSFWLVYETMILALAQSDDSELAVYYHNNPDRNSPMAGAYGPS